MKPRILRTAAAVLGLAALAACSSAPVQYYTLASPAPAEAAAAPRAPFLIEVLPVGMPEMLDRSQLVVRQGDAGVAVLDRQRWASPLSDELQAALSAQLASQLGAPDTAGLPRQPGAAVWRIKVEVRRLDAWPGRQLLLDSDWAANLSSDTPTRLTCSSRIALDAPADPAGLAEAHQAAVRQLAQQIAAAVRGRAC